MVPRHTLALALCAAPLLAQNDFDLDKTSSAAVGQSIDLAYSGAPAATLGIMLVSFTRGPTPILSFDPSDQRRVQVGTDLASLWMPLITGANGSGAVSLALPNNPAFADVVFHWQMVTASNGGPTILGPISNDVVTQLGVPRTGLLARAALVAARAMGAGFFDRDNNGAAADYVVAGGGTGSLTAAIGLQSTEFWDYRHMTVQAGPNLGTARALHLAVTLNDGRVLISGGADSSGNALASCELYDPATNTFAPAAGMSTPRIMHAACRMHDGRVMVAGGTSSLVDLTTAITSTLDTVEIYDPNTDAWSSGPSIGGKRLAPALTLLANNQVMVSGGVQISFLFGVPIAATSTTAVQRWNPATNSWSGGPNMIVGRAGHHYSQVTLPNGSVLFTGGIDVPSLLNAANAAPLAAAELFDGNSWSASTMAQARVLHTATVLPGGDVVVCGGAQGTLTTPTAIDGVERFDATTRTWSSLPPLTSPRSGHNAAMMPDGTLVLFGGQTSTTTLATIETLRF